MKQTAKWNKKIANAAPEMLQALIEICEIGDLNKENYGKIGDIIDAINIAKPIIEKVIGLTWNEMKTKSEEWN